MIRKVPRLIVVLAIISAANAAPPDEPTSLKEIMNELRNNLVEIADGLLSDDFDRIANGAIAIAEHPQIPATQIQLVAAELGPEMAAFKQLDQVVHDLSLEISEAAAQQDRDTSISLYVRMTKVCLGCHGTYKERVAAVLSESP